MAAATDRMVVIGAGLAGAGAAETLRQEGFAGEIVLISADAAYPYDHVPLSKNYLRGEPGLHRLFLHDNEFYEQQGIDLRLGTVVRAIDTAAHRIELDTGERLGYHKLLIATGSRNRRLRVPGGDLDGIHYLRSLAEADRLRAALGRSVGLVVVGAGFVGCEVAASARQLGLDVTLVGTEALPMLRALGPVGAAFYRDAHRAHGVHLVMDVRVTEFRGAGGAVRAVVLSDGTELPADAVVVGVGARPAVDLAAAAGIPVDDGITTDDTLATGAPDVYAAGDVARVPDPIAGGTVRVEHFATALTQGPVAARNMLGRGVHHRGVPFFFSDQYDVWMEFTGRRVGDAETVIRGDVDDGRFVTFWLRGDRLLAAMNINIRGVPDAVTPLIASGTAVDRAVLADPNADLAGLSR